MTEMEAIYGFWSDFSIPAFEKHAVPTKENEGAPDYPYLTFEWKTDPFGSPVSLTASLWYRSPSYEDVENKKKEIFERIGRGGIFLPYMDGTIWLKRREPFARYMKNEENDTVKRVDLNISAEFWTEE
jgi:hypothetical protein